MTLTDIVSSKRKAEILRLLFGLEPKEFHLRDLARQARLALRTVQLELVRLTGAGLVVARRDGNRVYYQANQRNPVYPDLRNIVLKTEGLVGVLHQALEGLEMELAFVFGSIAAGEAGPESDVDLMVIGPAGLRAVSRRLSGVGLKIGREINPHVMTREELAERVRSRDHFVSSLLSSPRLFIIGTENDFAELGK